MIRMQGGVVEIGPNRAKEDRRFILAKVGPGLLDRAIVHISLRKVAITIPILFVVVLDLS